MVVLTDSVQLGDRLAFDPTLGNFTDFNEPFYGALHLSIEAICSAHTISPFPCLCLEYGIQAWELSSFMDSFRI